MSDNTTDPSLRRSSLEMADPAVAMFKVTKGSALPRGSCRALWVGTPGTANVTDGSGNACANVPLIQGLNPFRIRSVEAGGTADDIWALY